MGPPTAGPAGTWLATFRKEGTERFEVSAGPGSSHSIASDGTCTALFDGLLHSRREWLDDSSLSTASDASLVLNAYLRWGEGLLERIRGLFALIIWDGGKDLLLCARDPHGMHPCFYADDAGDLFVSASAQALARHPRIPGTVDRVAIADHLCHRWPKLESTYFDAVRRLPGGYALRIREGRRTVARYWDPIPPGRPIDYISDEEAGRFPELLDQAVNRCLPGGPGRDLPERRARFGQHRCAGAGTTPQPGRRAAPGALAGLRASRRERRGHATSGCDEPRASPEDRQRRRRGRPERATGGRPRDERVSFRADDEPLESRLCVPGPVCRGTRLRGDPHGQRRRRVARGGSAQREACAGEARLRHGVPALGVHAALVPLFERHRRPQPPLDLRTAAHPRRRSKKHSRANCAGRPRPARAIALRADDAGMDRSGCGTPSSDARAVSGAQASSSTRRPRQSDGRVRARGVLRERTRTWGFHSSTRSGMPTSPPSSHVSRHGS